MLKNESSLTAMPFIDIAATTILKTKNYENDLTIIVKISTSKTILTTKAKTSASFTSS